MRNKILKISILPALIGLTFLSFSNKEGVKPSNNLEANNRVENLIKDVSKENKVLFTVDTTQISYALVQKDFIGFKEAVGHSESRGLYGLVNKFGYMGKYQFGSSALKTIGVSNSQEFLKRPDLQEAAFHALIAHNKWYMRKLIQEHEGQVISGVLITESGILAAAHLAGPSGVKRFLKSNGTNSPSDAFGTQVKHYLKAFAGYDLSMIKADKNARVNLNAFPGILDHKA